MISRYTPTSRENFNVVTYGSLAIVLDDEGRVIDVAVLHGDKSNSEVSLASRGKPKRK